MPNYYLDQEALEELGREIARLLGTSWHLDEDTDWSHCVVIKGREGTAIHIQPRNGRLSISGDYPPHKFHQDLDTPRITVSAEKDASTIANDICRRFLPEYLSTYRKAMDRKEVYEEREALRQQRLKKLAEIMGSEARNSRVYMPSHTPGYGTLAMYEGQAETVKIEVSSVPFETACKIAALLVEK